MQRVLVAPDGLWCTCDADAGGGHGCGEMPAGRGARPWSGCLNAPSADYISSFVFNSDNKCGYTLTSQPYAVDSATQVLKSVHSINATRAASFTLASLLLGP